MSYLCICRAIKESDLKKLMEKTPSKTYEDLIEELQLNNCCYKKITNE